MSENRKTDMQQDEDLKCLDELIAAVGGSHDAAPTDLLLEHLRATRRYLLGSTRAEYCFCLEQAKESVFAVRDKTARIEIKATLQSLIASGAQIKRRPTTAAAGHCVTQPGPARPGALIAVPKKEMDRYATAVAPIGIYGQATREPTQTSGFPRKRALKALGA